MGCLSSVCQPVGASTWAGVENDGQEMRFLKKPIQSEKWHSISAEPLQQLPLCGPLPDVDDNGHRKGHGQPAVGLPNPFAFQLNLEPPIWNLL